MQTALFFQHLRSFKMEAAGIEPGCDSGATLDSACDCEKCLYCRAAYALHLDCFKRHLLASFDADLQSVISAWLTLPPKIRTAIITLVDPP
jgi:hypothetical protein